MRKTIIPISLLLFLVACQNQFVEKPFWVNSSYTITFPNDSLVFKTAEKNWEVQLLSFTQPIPVKIKYNDQGFTITAKNRFGIIEGPAQIIISKGSQEFYYQFNLQNNSPGVISENDYRSPKTVNPDSSMSQQIILHSIDEWRNITTLPQQSKPFNENIIQIKPVAGTYRAQEKKALSSFYVQPGSSSSINVKANYIKSENAFLVTAGPLTDKHNNTIANGTIVAFIYTDNEYTYRMETAVKNGYATMKVPVKKNIPYRLIAKINETTSKQIQFQL